MGRFVSQLRAAEKGRKKVAPPQPTRRTTPGCRHYEGKRRAMGSDNHALTGLGNESLAPEETREDPPAPQPTQMNELNKTRKGGWS